MGYINKAILIATVFFCAYLSLSAQNISLNMSNVTVKEAMDQLKKTSGYSFVFSSIDVNTRNRISISVKNATIDAVVKQILQGQEGLSYEIKDKNIIVKKVQPPVSPAKKITATGKVIDSSGYPIDGVTVLEKGTQNGTFTDRDGNFSLNTTDNAILSFSFIGFTKQEINAATEMKISLKENVEMLEDVVITGYMNIDKGSYVGAISTVKVDEIKVAGESSIDYMLQGVVPGMSVLMSSGQVGATPKIRIRGTSTILGNQEPVWVVDGIIQLDPLPIPTDMGSLAKRPDRTARDRFQRHLLAEPERYRKSHRTERRLRYRHLRIESCQRRHCHHHQESPSGTYVGFIQRIFHHWAKAGLRDVRHDEFTRTDAVCTRNLPRTFEIYIRRTAHRLRQPDVSTGKQTNRQRHLCCRIRQDGDPKHRLVRSAVPQQFQSKPQHQHRRGERKHHQPHLFRHQQTTRGSHRQQFFGIQRHFKQHH